jgi:predicted outer membrane repeat protein
MQTISRRLRVNPLALALFAGLGLSANAMAAFQVPVTASGDAGNNATCTLRQAITTLNNSSAVNTACVPSSISGSTDTIVFDTATFPPNGANTITLADATNNQLSITDSNLTIDASANGNVTVQRSATATNAFGIFYFYASNKAGNLTIKNLTIGNGKLTAAQPSGVALGAGIASMYGNLTVIDSVITGNAIATSGYGAGGGIVVYTGNLTLANSTVSNNSVSSFSGASGHGGGVFVRPNIYTHAGGNATITGSQISGNTAKGNGGGLHVGGTLTMTGSRVTDNTANNNGGGMKIYAGTTLTNSTVSGNAAPNGGGGIYDAAGYHVPQALLTLNGTTLNGNRVTNSGGARGGAIFTRYGNLSFLNSTIAGNSATLYGGAIYVKNNTQPVTFQQTTIASNTAGNRGGGLMIATSGAGTVTFNGTLFDNTIAPSMGGANIAVTTGGIAIAGSDNLVFGSGLINAAFNAAPLTGDPKLTPLGNFGGPTKTLFPLAGSAAIDAIPATGGSCPVAIDQRGVARPQGAGCDVGTAEADAATGNDIIFIDGFD